MKSRKRQIIPLGILFLFAGFDRVAFGASKIVAIDFHGTKDPNLLEIRSDGPVTFEKQENAKDKQIILELKGATIQPSLTRKIDTSSFDSRVLLISPYQVEGQTDVVRVILQLRERVEIPVTQDGNRITASIPVKGGLVSDNIEELSETAESLKEKKLKDDLGTVHSAGHSEDNEGDGSASTERMKTFIANRESKKFKGKPITLQVRDVDAADVFRLIGDASGFNIILTDDVKGKLTLSLSEVPWDEALDVVLKILGLTAERNKNILRIVSVRNYTQEKIDEFRANQAANAAQPRVTRIFPISYAKLDDLSGMISKLQAAQNSSGSGVESAASPSVPGSLGGGASGASSSSGGIFTDKRTNSIIVMDRAENIERIKKLVEILDTQTPQVLLEGKVVEVSENYATQMAGNLGVGLPGQGSGFLSFAGGNPIDTLIGGSGSPFSGGSSISASSATGGAMGVGFLPGSSRLNAILNMGESEDKLKLVASPRVVVLSGESANITQSTPVLIPVTTLANGATTVTYQNTPANLNLDVRPTVTNDGNVRLDLNLSRDLVQNSSSGQPASAARNIRTNVVVESGTTLVLGGVYTMSDDRTESGFPLLRKIPILGALFGKETSNKVKNELIFFITPQILNPKKAGFGNS